MPDTTAPGTKVRNLAGVALALRSRVANSSIIRSAQGLPVIVEGINPGDFPSALQPIAPFGSPGRSPMSLPIVQGQNLDYTPRADAEYSTKDLQLFGTYPLARMCIDQVKDLVADLPWQINAKQLPGETNASKQDRERADPNITKLTKQFAQPNPEQDWADFIRRVFEDLLVLDAPAIYLRRYMDADRTIGELRVIPGETIVRYIDDNGYTPQAPSVAYAQLWNGMPFTNLTTDDVVYRPRNIVPRGTQSSQLYGMSPTEKLAKYIEIGQLRLAFIHAYYKDGSVPGVMQIVPADVNTDQIKKAQDWITSNFAGNLTKRQQWQMIQGFQQDGKPEQIIFTKEQLLTDAFDDLHIRQVAFGYGVSPQRLLRMMNRAASQSNQEAAEEEGIQPYIGWLKRCIDFLIQVCYLLPGYEWLPQPTAELDEKTEADIDLINAKTGVQPINERRKARGLDPINTPEANMLGIVTMTGFIPLAIDDQIANSQAKIDAGVAPDPTAEPTTTPGGGNDDKPPKKKKPPAGSGSKKKLGKRSNTRITIDPRRVSPTLDRLREKAAGIMSSFFAEAITASADAAGSSDLLKLQKDTTDPLPLSSSEIDDLLDDMMAAIPWKELPSRIDTTLKSAAEEGVDHGIGDLQQAGALPSVARAYPIPAAVLAGLAANPLPDNPQPPTAKVRALISEIHSEAAEAASKRAAELVGMRWQGNKLIANPRAEWAITETTRDRLRTVITDSFSRISSKSELRQAIQDSAAFSPERSLMIARTEVNMAQSQANFTTWKKSGVVIGTTWHTSGDHDVEDTCDDNEGAGVIPLSDEYPTGDLHAPAHPFCNCYNLAVVKHLS